MSYDVKRTEYAFLPDGPYPLDARSHFATFDLANATITGDKVSTVELANESNDTQKFYYHGEIITTTEGGVYQVCGKNQYYSGINIPNIVGTYTGNYEGSRAQGIFTIEASDYWLAQSCEFDTDNPIVTCTIDDNHKLISLHFTVVLDVSLQGSFNVKPIWAYKDTTDCYLRPFSGSGGGGGSSLIINPSGGLSNPNTGLQIKIPEVSGVQINNAGLSIKILNPTTDTDGTIHGSGITISANGISLNTGPGLTINDTGQLTVNYGKGLTINPETNALEVDGDLDVRGVHSSVDRDYDVDKNILEGNYVYQEI